MFINKGHPKVMSNKWTDNVLFCRQAMQEMLTEVANSLLDLPQLNPTGMVQLTAMQNFKVPYAYMSTMCPSDQMKSLEYSARPSPLAAQNITGTLALQKLRDVSLIPS